AELDRFCDALEDIAKRAATGDESLKAAPFHAPLKRLDETRAARKPVLKWTPPPEGAAVAAE
ncbi:MAG: aminomethyl-transferring glycine dehydrogenase subunit GcvPB, partial [Pseudomonadota bacterium]